MNPADLFKTPFIGEQVRLLIAEKRLISVKQVYTILGYKTTKERHAVSNAIWRMKNSGAVEVTDGVILFKGTIPAKKKIDSIWDALRNNPSTTAMELTCLSLASKRYVQNTLAIYKKKGLVRCVGRIHVQGVKGMRTVPLYTLTTKERCRPI